MKIHPTSCLVEVVVLYLPILTTAPTANLGEVASNGFEIELAGTSSSPATGVYGVMYSTHEL